MAILERCDTGAIAQLTMNAPERLNCLSDEMLAALQSELDQIAADPKIRVVTLAGAGKAFCAGHDLKQMTAGRTSDDKGRSYFADLFQRCSNLMLTIQSLPQPVIAQVHGIATAAGCQLVATCDMAIAAEGTRFGVNGINIGLFCSTPMVALSRNIPRKKAFEMLTTGQFLTATEAEAAGLVNRVVTPELLDQETLKLAETVAGKLGSVVKIGKEAFYKQATMPTEQAYDYAADVMVQNMLFQDTEEGIQAFLDKRAPNWSQ
ncbi:Enoyl-CoA hydratase/carnithine racemase [Cognatishimia maritima]|uniref:Enoyl-CoA hydratase domain-containing protein 3, mitochondrial n=2 Tax=Cognatishimia maritima TaxID=870908 RepID=A0A1M5I703_9RHOB|nr:Enoyl-CoA hydratase/carnithine racemase [Cognatishimia maritima]